MGFLSDRRERKREAEEARRDAQRVLEERAAHAAWADRLEVATQHLELAESWYGAPIDGYSGFIEKKGEVAYLIISGTALIEPRRTKGQWQGRSSGVSFRVMKGVNYRVGATRGTYAPGPDVPTPIDHGDTLISNQRVVFIGQKASREWSYAKLMGIMHDTEDPWTALQVSNRQKVSGFLYGWEIADEVQWRLTLAMATYLDERPQLIASLQSEVDELRATEPHDPDRPAIAPPPPPPPAEPPEPHGRHAASP